MTAMQPLDEEEVRRAMRGDEVACARVCLALLPRLYGVARRVTGRDDLAEEAAQEAVLRLLRGLPALRDPARIDAWALTIAGNVARNLVARARTSSPVAVDEVAVEPGSGAADPGRREGAIDAAVASLAPSERELFLLHTVEGVSLRELALAHDTNESAMKARVHRIRAKVRARALEHLQAAQEVRL